MPLVPDSSQNIHSDKKTKKTFQKGKTSHHARSRITNETSAEHISEKLFSNVKENQEKVNNNERNKSFLKQTSKEQDLKILVKKKPFISTLQDFPELKSNSNSDVKKLNTESYCKMGYNKSWGNRIKKKEPFPPLSSVNSKARSKTEFFNERDKLTQTTDTGLCDAKEDHYKLNLNTENSKEEELIPNQDVAVQSITTPKKKKRGDPVFINLHDILDVNKAKTRGKKISKSKFQRQKNTEHISGNCLDSSNPKRLRGKYREVKKKRLTTLKLAIIKERIVKQKSREKSIAQVFGNETVNFVDTIDFKNEINVYLKELSERKSKQRNVRVNNKIKKTNSGENININKEVETSGKTKKLDKTIPAITPEGNFQFSSKFREYCDNIITPDLNSALSSLIKESVNLQDKSFLRDPIKAKARKRHVTGIREVRKYLIMKKAKVIVIAPNLEKLQMEGSLHDVINDLKSAAQAQNVPYAFALDRYKLGRLTKKNIPVSAFAILSCEGVEGLFHNVLDHLQQAKAQFREMVKPKAKKEEDIITAEVNSKIIASFISAFQKKLEISDENSDLK